MASDHVSTAPCNVVYVCSTAVYNPSPLTPCGAVLFTSIAVQLAQHGEGWCLSTVVLLTQCGAALFMFAFLPRLKQSNTALLTFLIPSSDAANMTLSVWIVCGTNTPRCCVVCVWY